MAEDEGQKQSDDDGGGGGLLGGSKGWIILVAVVFLEALFFMVLIHFSKTAPSEADDGDGTLMVDEGDFMKYTVPVTDLTFSIPTPGAGSQTLSMDILIELGRQGLRKEQADKIQPTHMDKFKELVKTMEPVIKDRLRKEIGNMTGLQLQTQRGQDEIANFLRREINHKLGRIKISGLEDVNTERVNEVYITRFYLQ